MIIGYSSIAVCVRKVEFMSPRKERYQTPKYVVKAIRDRRKQLLHGSYYCPKCGMNKLRIEVDKEKKEAIAVCACGTERRMKYVSAFESVDYYNKFLDQFPQR
jgi:transcription elongation factor Elf1